MFQLHPQLAADCFDLGRFWLCRVLLMNDERFPWIILVPERDGIEELHELEEADQTQLWRESNQLARYLQDRFQADKLNIAALGNVVPQLHIHHVVRYRTDACWPSPIWGQGQAMPYPADQKEALIQQFRSDLELQN